MGHNGYNKRREELKWKKEWNKKEELLKKYGWADNLIQELHDFEWAQFNSDRRFYEKLKDYKDDYLERFPEKPKSHEVDTIEDIFDIVQDETVLSQLKKAEKPVLIFFVMRANDYKIEQIAEELHMTAGEIYGRVYRFRQKISKKRKK